MYNVIKKYMAKITDNSELLKNISIITIIMYPIILLLLSKIINNESIATYITYFVVVILAIPGLIAVFLKDKKKLIIMLICFITVVIINYIFHLKTVGQSIHIIIKNFITCYLIFMMTVTIKDKELLFKSLKFGGYISTALTLIYVLMMQNNKTVLLENGLSIQLVLAVFLPINLVYAFKEKKIFNCIFTILGMLLISLFSSRTIILAIWSFGGVLTITYFIKWFNNIRNYKVKRIIKISVILMIFLILMIAINIQEISTGIYNFLNQRGIYIRTLRLLSEGEYISYSSGRTDTVYPEMINKILEAPIIGHGIGMDRISVNNRIYYAHNIVLELYVSFGIIMGSIIILLIIKLIIKALKSEYKLFIVGLIFSGLIILMLTTSYTMYRGFWLLLGLLINVCMLENKEEENNEICINRMWKNFTKSFRSSGKQ